MPSCCIKQCSARKSKNQSQLTMHRIPKNEVMRRKWLEAIGTENINFRPSILYVCGLHFDDSQLNKTLNVIRLRDDVVPTLCSVRPSNIKEQVIEHDPLSNQPRTIPEQTDETPSTSKEVAVLSEINIQEAFSIPSTVSKNVIQIDEVRTRSNLQRLKNKCEEQRKKIKRLHEKIRRQGNKILRMQKVIVDLKRQMITNTEESEEFMLIEECGES